MAALLDIRKAQDVVVLNVQAMTVIADFFVMATAANRTHLGALGEAMEDRFKSEIHHREGNAKSDWWLIDMKDVIVHLFLPEARAYYALENLWAEAPRVPLKDKGART